jgi:peptidoglycan/xylan/chitin deacetylase (PgdA/CDA1 family)
MNPVRSCILTYHSLDRSGSVISIRPETFEAQMQWLAEAGAPVVPLETVQQIPGSVAITFDDGFRNFYEHAFPVLQRLRFPATVFVVSGYCGQRNDWPTQPRAAGIPDLELMGWSELEEVARAGIRLGSHTVTHPHLGALDEKELERELSQSRAAIEDRTGRAADTFAYPYGESTAAVREVVRSRFTLACGTRLGWLNAGDDPADLPRLEMYYLQNLFWFRGLRSWRGSLYLAVRGLLRDARARMASDLH